MTDEELVARLRNYGHVGTVLEAADRIEALVKEKDQEYKDSIVRMAGQAKDFMEEISTLKARNKQLEAALRGLMAHEPDYPDTLWQEARTALKGN